MMSQRNTWSPIAGLRILIVCDAPRNQANPNELTQTLQDSLEVTLATSSEACKLLRQQVFDVALVWSSPHLDAVDYLPTLRTGAPESLAIVVVTGSPTLGLEAACLAADADEYHCLSETDADRLACRIHRAVERRQLLCQANQWSNHQAKTLQDDQQEAIHQIRSLRSILLDADASTPPPEWLVGKFAELLRAYVVAVSGDLADEVGQLVVGLKQSGVTLCEALMAHSVATEQLVIGIGARPGWHILGRSQMLAYELLMQYSRDNGLSASDSPVDSAVASS